ncbi:hypothetical protein STEG23_018059, partial [Scotinomys teguina]
EHCNDENITLKDDIKNNQPVLSPLNQSFVTEEAITTIITTQRVIFESREQQIENSGVEFSLVAARVYSKILDFETGFSIMILMHLLIESLLSLPPTGLLELCLVFGCGSLHLPPSVTGEKLCDDD